MATTIRTSFGSQIREALTECKTNSTLLDYDMTVTDKDGIRYTLTEQTTPSLTATSVPLSPGEVADWLNSRGYDIRFGK